MSASKERILMIDDDPDMHLAIRTILEPQGYAVSCCGDGPAGLAAMRRERPNLLLLDVMMATPSEGFHILYEMKQDAELATIPVVVVSSIGRETGVNFAKDVGTDYIPANAFLEKPVDAAKLIQLVGSLLRGAPGSTSCKDKRCGCDRA